MIAVLEERVFARLNPILAQSQAEPTKAIAAGFTPRRNLLDRRKCEIDEHDGAKANAADT
jgi:hypothetical protein